MVARGGRSGLRLKSARVASFTLSWALVLCLADCASAHEVDQYALPPETLVDIGDYWDHLLHDAVQGAVDEANFKIRQAGLIPVGAARKAYVRHCLSHDTLAFAVRSRLPCALMAIEGLEAKLFCRNHLDAPAGKKYGHFAAPWSSVYAGAPHLPDLRQIGRLSFMRCSVVNIHDTYMGTDKIAHFVSMGYVGFRSYRYQLQRGTPPAKAMRRAVDLNVQGLLGETGILGGLPTGIISNADLAADYLGMKFYLNLREPVTLHGETVPPMLIFENSRLALRADIQQDSSYFGMFVSDHLDEVLNPNLFEPNMRDAVRHGVKQYSQTILDRYAGDDPERRTPQYFDQLLETYSTYYGEYYGHSGQFEKLITVGNTCFEAK